MNPELYPTHTEFRAQLHLLRRDEGGRHTPIFDRYRPQFVFGGVEVSGVVTLPTGVQLIVPGDSAGVTVQLIQPVLLDEGVPFTIREGRRTVGDGWVTAIVG
jgi:elongation factor Tu